MKSNLYILFIFFFLFSNSRLFATVELDLSNQISFSQTDSLFKGIVNDSGGLPIIGATVRVKGKQNWTQTDSKGRFSLTSLKISIGDTLQVSFQGYHSKEIVINSYSSINITLFINSYNLDEVTIVSTGYQNTPKERATGSFVLIDNELLNRRVSPDLISRLENVTSALYMDRRTGGEPKLSIRGRSTIFANDQPLVVVDNFPYDGDLNNINPNDVENITILKDAAAASIWGVRAGNGVIVIKTKNGRKNQPLKVEVNANTTIGQKPDIFYNQAFIKSTDFMEVERWLYGQGYYQSWIDDQNKKPLSPLIELLEKSSSEGEINQQIALWKDYDIRNDISRHLLRPSTNQQYALSFRGGGDKSAYSLSTGYDRMTKNEVGNYGDRFTINGNLNFSPIKNLDMTTNLVYTMSNRVDNSLGSSLNIGSGTIGIYPYARLVDSDGNNLALEQNYRTSYKNEMVDRGLLDWSYRPLDEVGLRDIGNTGHEIRLNTGLRYSLPFNFSTDVRYQYQRTLGLSNSLYNSESYYVRNLVNRYTDLSGVLPIQNIQKGAINNSSNNDGLSQTGRFQLNYDNTFSNGDHELHALAGFEVREYVTNSSSNATMYGYDPEVLTISPVNYNQQYTTLPSGFTTLIPNAQSQGRTLDRFRSYFGNASYTYQGKYTFSGSARVDQSNYFGVTSNQKSVPLWSMGLAWNANKESFIDQNMFSLLKLRATYGYNGNLDRTITAFVTAGYLFDSYNGLNKANILNPPNPELRWEKIGMSNIGLDFALRNDILSGSIEFYHKSGVDMIGYQPLEPTTGAFNFSTNSYGYKGNFASTSGQGIDLTLNAKIFRRSKFAWYTNVLFSLATDKVTSYKTESAAFNYLVYGAGLIEGTIAMSPMEGKPVNGIYAYRWGGLDRNTGNPIGYLNGSETQDYNAISTNTKPQDLIFAGRALPTYFGTLGNTLSYGQFKLSINVTYRFGYFFRRNGLSYSSLYSGWSGHEEYNQRWQSIGDENWTSVPSRPLPTLNNLANRDSFYLMSEELVEKGDNIRLQDVQLSYVLNKKLLPWLGNTSMQIYGYANKFRYALESE